MQFERSFTAWWMVITIGCLLITQCNAFERFDDPEFSGRVGGPIFNGSFCIECERVIADVQQALGNDTTVQHIIQLLDSKLCAQFPIFERKICQNLVRYLMTQLEYLDSTWVDRYTPKATCSALNFCTVECCENPYLPEQVHISVTSSPSEMVVMWTTSEPTKNSNVFYGTSSNALNQLANGTFSTYKVSGWRGVIHTVTLTGLSANTTYYYQVGDPSYGLCQPSFTFTTRPSSNDITYTTAIYGDMGSNDISDDTLYQLRHLVKTNQLDMIVHAGDISYADGYDALWDDMMRKLEPVGAYIPYMVAPGNHEFFYNFTAYKKRFQMPWQESGSLSESLYYSFDYGPIHWIAYDCEKHYGRAPDLKVNGTQYNWLQQDLARANANRANVPWIIMFGHRPLYCTQDNKRCNQEAERYRGMLEPLIHTYNVDLVIQAHNHNYERTTPVYQNTAYPSYNNPKATVYLVVGAAGCREGLYNHFETNPPSWSVARIATYGFGLLTANRTSLAIEFYSASQDQVLDSFAITKS